MGPEFWIPFAASQLMFLGTLLYKMGRNTERVELQIKYLDEKIDTQKTDTSDRLGKVEGDIDRMKDRVTWAVSKLGGGLEVNP